MRPIILLLGCLSPLFAFSQSGFAGFTLRADYGSYRMPENDLNDFFRSYNDYYGASMKVPFDTLSATVFSHPSFGAGVRYASPGVVGFSTGLFVQFGRKAFTQQSQFQNDIITETSFLVKDYTYQIDVGFHVMSILFIHGLLAGHTRNATLDLGYYYQDGSYTLGNEYDILGVYSALNSTLDVGFGAMLKLGPVIIPVSISYPTNAFSDGGLISIMDFDTHRVRWNELPRDFRTWADDPVNMDLDNGFVRGETLNSVRINVGIEILLGGEID